jgi:hypothetical protein
MRVEGGRPGTKVPGRPHAWDSGITGIPGTCRCADQGVREPGMYPGSCVAACQATMPSAMLTTGVGDLEPATRPR